VKVAVTASCQHLPVTQELKYNITNQSIGSAYTVVRDAYKLEQVAPEAYEPGGLEGCSPTGSGKIIFSGNLAIFRPEKLPDCPGFLGQN